MLCTCVDGWCFLERLNRDLARRDLALLRFVPSRIKSQVIPIESLHVVGWNM